MDIDAAMDTSEDFDDGVVRWVASQSANPALQALMKEAEREKRSRPSTPVLEPLSWTHSLTSTSSCPSLSTSLVSAWHSNGNNAVDTSYILPLSGNTSSASSSSSALRPSEPSASRRAKPLVLAHRNLLSTSASSANLALRSSARPRSASHSSSKPSTSIPKYVSPEEEPEAVAFLELLRDVSRQLDENSRRKQRLAARAHDKERERSLGSNGDAYSTNDSSPRRLTKTSSASAICPLASSSALETTSSTSTSAFNSKHRARVLAKTASLGAPGVGPGSEKPTPSLLSNPNLNCRLKRDPVPRVLPRTSSSSNTPARMANAPEPTSDEDERNDSAMQDIVIDLTETDTKWERPPSGQTRRADTTACMQVHDDDSDMGMNVSFFQAPPPRQTHVPAPKPKLVPSQTRTASRPPAPTQGTRPGPPPLGMRRPPQLQPSQYSLSQAPKGVSVPPFKPPLLASAGRTVDRGWSGTKRANTTSSSIQPRRGVTTEVEKTVARASQDADSSFDVSFDVDGDALEEAMKAYD